MFKNIFFIGGIHGVGKSTFCHQICHSHQLKYLSASEVLKWNNINEDPNNKKIKNISDNQDQLIIGLKSVVKENYFYVLDGHYCLLNKKEEIVKVPLETFKQINPLSLSLIVSDISDIKQRLDERDKQIYSNILLERMQAAETNYAREIAKNLKVPLTIGGPNDREQIIFTINEILQKKHGS